MFLCMLLLVFQTSCFLCAEGSRHIEDNLIHILFVVLIILLESEKQNIRNRSFKR